MKQTQFYPCEIKKHFNLRNPKSATPTNVYLVMNVRGKQYKVSLFVKVYPSQWSKTKQKAIISNMFSVIDNKNNSVVNEKIKLYNKKFEFFLDYLCSNDSVNIINLVDQVFYNDMKKQKKQYSIAQLIDEAFSFYITYICVNIKQDSRDNYQRLINRFKRYLVDNKLDFDLGVLTQDGVNDYRNYLVDNLKKKEWGYSYVNDSLRILCALINHVFTTQSQFKKIYQFEKVSYSKVQDPREGIDKGGFALEKEEIKAFVNCNNLSHKQEEYRRFFLLELALGGREGGVINAIKDYSIDEDNNILTYKANKTRKGKINYAIISLDPLYEGFPAIKDYLLGELRPNLSILSDGRAFNAHYNKALKEIAKKLNLDRLVEYVNKYGDIVKAPVKDAIHGHCARHTFITQAIRASRSVEEICSATGHIDDTMIKKVYAHLTTEDKIEKVKELREKRILKIDSDSTNEKVIDIIKKGIAYEQEKESDNARNYLIQLAESLGVDWKQWMDADSLSDTEKVLYKLSEILHDHNKEIIKVDLLKDYFNKNKGNIEKAKAQFLEYYDNKELAKEFSKPLEF